MGAKFTFPANLKAILFGLVLLCAQTVALGHDTQHAQLGDPEHCATCVLGSNLSNAVADASAVFAFEPAEFSQPDSDNKGHTSATIQTPRSRGPPKTPLIFI